MRYILLYILKEILSEVFYVNRYSRKSDRYYS